MRILHDQRPGRVLLGLAILLVSPAANAQLRFDEQQSMQFPAAESVSGFRMPPCPAPVTVASPDAEQFEQFLPLDEAIRLTLQHSEVIRVLTGVSAVSSGSTIYDTAIATTPIDQAVARFDPVFTANSSFRHNESPFSQPDPANPFGALIGGTQTSGTALSAGLRQTNRLGGIGEFRAIDNWSRLGAGGPASGSLDPTHRPALELSYTQPLLAGFGLPANRVPIVIAQLQQDQSFFQFKGSVQELVRGTIAGYWSLVEARTTLWARERQVETLKLDFDIANAKFRIGLNDIGDVSQRKVSYYTFRANLIAAQANVLQREAALRNLLGLPPEDGRRLVPSTPPTRDRVEFHWDDLVRTSQANRPDIAELNLILLADQQQLIQGRNLAQPGLNAVALQRWNGLSGRALNASTISADMSDHTDWTLGVTFSVPLGLRQTRAQVRTRELLIARDRANIQQSLHQIQHLLATSIRTIDQNLLQYEAFLETRQAAAVNLRVQVKEEDFGRLPFLNVLQAITDWGNAVASEAQSLTAYNTELANLELQTGTILETHGIRFIQERYGSISAWGRHFEDDCYPQDLRPADNAARYRDSGEAAEEAFDLNDYPKRPADDPPLILPRQPEISQPLEAPAVPHGSKKPPVPDPEKPRSMLNQVRSVFETAALRQLFP